MQSATLHLEKVDPVMAKIIKRVGALPIHRSGANVRDVSAIHRVSAAERKGGGKYIRSRTQGHGPKIYRAGISEAHARAITCLRALQTKDRVIERLSRES
jgi:hypothetical protein